MHKNNRVVQQKNRVIDNHLIDLTPYTKDEAKKHFPRQQELRGARQRPM